MRTSEIAKRVVVTFAGEDVAQIKDVLYVAAGRVGGFTLNGRGLLSGPLKVALPWSDIAALGRDAVMVESEASLKSPDALFAEAGASGGEAGGDVLGSRVLTDDGTDLGKVVDVVIEVFEERRPYAEVVGYEIEPSAALGKDAKRLLVPLPDTISVSGEHLVVPAAAKDFVGNDLAGFGAAVTDFRARLAGSA